jgi:hypothetical protein
MLAFESLPVFAIAWIAAALALAGFVHGALGLGFPLVATPLIALATNIKTAVIIVAPPTLVVVIAAIVIGGGLWSGLREWWRMPIYMMLGSLCGTYVFMRTAASALTLLLALAILVYLGLDWIGRGESKVMKAHRHKFAAPFGFFGGFFEGSVNIAAPPLLIYFLSLGLAPAALVKALNLCFFTGKSTQLATLVAAADVSGGVWWVAIPASMLGVCTLILGMRVRSRVDATTYRRWVKAALLVMVVILLGQYFLGL